MAASLAKKSTSEFGSGTLTPTNFTDPAVMLGASSALLQGKIMRGGMGTGMPEFGSLYTDEELWGMVAYVRTFLFQSLSK